MNSLQFGGKASEQDLKRYRLSPQWADGSFQNQEPTSLMPEWYKLPGIICRQIKGSEAKAPQSPLPVAPFSLETFMSKGAEADDRARFIWYGHSVLLLRMAGQTLLIDPMMGPDASPIGPVRTKRFSDNTLDLLEDFPEIDWMLLTHDHYDHLDLASIRLLQPKVRKYAVALGVKRHLVRWGIPAEHITELDWWDTLQTDSLNIHFTPTRHFSGRGWNDRGKSLWGGWVLKSAQENIWFSGDGGYGQHFREVGRSLGPFDLAFMECGQYSPDWATIHMFPDEAVQAALDAAARKVIPVHWGAFALSYSHNWFDPVEAFRTAAEKTSISWATPAPGELFTVEQVSQQDWWSVFK